MPIYLLVDTSGSMCVASTSMSKYAWAVQIAGGLALAALARMSPVGMVGCGERALDARPSLSRHRVFLWLHQLRHYRFDEQTTLVKKLDQLSAVLKNRAMLIVLSDLRQPEAVTRLKRLAQEHDCVALQLTDPAERGRLRAGIFRGEEAETGEAFVGHGWSRWFRDDDTAAELRRGGIDHLELPMNEPFLHRLRGFLRKTRLPREGHTMNCRLARLGLLAAVTCAGLAKAPAQKTNAPPGAIPVGMEGSRRVVLPRRQTRSRAGRRQIQDYPAHSRRFPTRYRQAVRSALLRLRARRVRLGQVPPPRRRHRADKPAADSCAHPRHPAGGSRRHADR